jgi:hypothetical protein
MSSCIEVGNKLRLIKNNESVELTAVEVASIMVVCKQKVSPISSMLRGERKSIKTRDANFEVMVVNNMGFKIICARKYNYSKDYYIDNLEQLISFFEGTVDDDRKA